MKIERTRLVTGLKYAGIALTGFFVLAQFVPVDRSNPPVGREIEAPVEVAAVLERACYDCHSNETTWPAYSRVAPASWLVARDVNEGREHLNYSDWGRYSAEERRELMDETWEEVAEGKMPMKPYLLLHPGAKLSTEDLGVLRSWTQKQTAPGAYAYQDGADTED